MVRFMLFYVIKDCWLHYSRCRKYTELLDIFSPEFLKFYIWYLEQDFCIRIIQLLSCTLFFNDYHYRSKIEYFKAKKNSGFKTTNPICNQISFFRYFIFYWWSLFNNLWWKIVFRINKCQENIDQLCITEYV